MATIVYLDADDEITSAAARIRTADDARVGLVLPFGSRVATSRINFRLLAREALVTGRRLDIVAPDAAARALAASAGLAVFGSVGEYESALDAIDDAEDPTTDLRAVGLGAAAAAAVTPAALPGRRPADRPLARHRPHAAGPRADHRTRVGRLRRTGHRERRPPTRSRSWPAAACGRIGRAGASAAARSRSGSCCCSLLGAGAVAAVTVLPTADITVTPRIETIGPIAFSVTADPAATTVDPEAGVIPATTVQVPVTVSGEFPATGKKVVREKATGGGPVHEL